MLVHSVFFWLDPGLSGDKVADFEKRLNDLLEISTILHGFVGKPAGTRRPVVDCTYSYALTLVFENMEGHDSYQVHPVHKAFVADCAPYWVKVQIYDAA